MTAMQRSMSGCWYPFVAQPEVAVVGRHLHRRAQFLAVGNAERKIAAARLSKTSASNHDGWRNSKAALVPSGSTSVNSRSTSVFFLNVGGSWNSSVASFGPSDDAVRQNVCARSSHRCNLASCVIRRGALSVNVK